MDVTAICVHDVAVRIMRDGFSTLAAGFARHRVSGGADARCGVAGYRTLRTWLPVLALLCLAGWYGPSSGRAVAQLAPQRVEGLAAIVGGHYPGPTVDTLLRSDVELRARLRLAQQGLPDASPTPALLRASLTELIGEVLIAREAQRVQVGAVRNADVERERRRIAVSMGGDASLYSWLRRRGASESEIDDMAERRAQVALFLAANLEGEHITRAEVDAALAAAGKSVEEASPELREVMRAQLSRAALERAVERWVRVLWARSVVRITATFDGGQ